MQEPRRSNQTLVQLGSNRTYSIESGESASKGDSSILREISQHPKGSNKIDADMIAEMEAYGVNDVLTADQSMEDMNERAFSFTQFMGSAEFAVNDFFETGYIMANLDGALTTNIAKVLVSIRYSLYVSSCITVAAVATAVGMVIDRIVIDVVTRRFEITVGRKGKIAFLLIFGVLAMGCTWLLAYWLFQGPAWLPAVLIVVFVAAMFALQKSTRGKKWFDEMTECVYLIIAPLLFISKYGLAAMGKYKIAFPYDA